MSAKTPGRPAGTAGAGEGTAGAGAANPDSGAANPDSGAANPDSGAANPDSGAENHDSGAGRAYLRLVLLGAAIGIPAALLAALFIALVQELEHLLWHELPTALGSTTPPWYLVIGLPIVGAAIVIAARRLLPGDGGNPPLRGLAGDQVLLSHGPGVALAAVGTLSFGAVLGPEAPLIALGSVAGLALASLARVDARSSKVLASAGSFSAISALFGGPIVGGMLMIEGGLAMGSALIPMLLPGFVAAAIGYVLFVGFGSWGGLNMQSLAVPGLPLYRGVHVFDLLLALLVGVLAALLIAAVRRGAGTIAQRGPQRLNMPALLLGGGLAVGLLAQLAVWLGADSQEVLFSGQASVPALVAQSSTGIVFVLLIAKALAYAVSLGCGYRGGPVFPAIFLGVAIATLPVVWFGVSPTLAISIGTAAGMTATTRLLLTPMVFAALLTGESGLHAIPATVLAAVAAWLTMTMLDHRSSIDHRSSGGESETSSPGRKGKASETSPTPQPQPTPQATTYPPAAS
jgi:H+/Cl- antiporter ClcA